MGNPLTLSGQPDFTPPFKPKTAQANSYWEPCLPWTARHLQRELQKKEMGVVYTPTTVATILSTWAVRNPSDMVLEPAAGRGVFVSSLIARFEELGLSRGEALSRIFSVEMDARSWKSLRSQFGNRQNILHADFLTATLPVQFEGIVGNPPYIERQLVQNYQTIRENPEFKGLNRLTDIYGYFIVKSGTVLKPGGRLAFVISDTWMNMNFGEKIKAYLLENFRIRAIISFDRRLFPEVLVRAVLLLCEKKSALKDEVLGSQVLFVRIRDASGVRNLLETLDTGRANGATIVRKAQSELTPAEPWSVYLKCSDVYFTLLRSPFISKLSNFAETNIGLFSLANNFYIINGKKKKQLGLEDDYLEEIAVGPRDTPSVIESRDQLGTHVLYCKKSREQLAGTVTLRYIESGERTKVFPVGKRFSVVGYNKLPRLQRARREPWYNLVDEIDRRCRAPILFPRRVYGRFSVVWNKPLVVAGDNFICITPHRAEYTEPLLCILNSSLTEYFVRVRAQIYGGGVNDMRPDDVKNLSTIDFTKLPSEVVLRMSQAYRNFLATEDKQPLDKEIFAILDFSPEKILAELHDLQSLSRTTSNS
jgi:tRNA1(Val) A37 N6-methylase TrmN6